MIRRRASSAFSAGLDKMKWRMIAAQLRKGLAGSNERKKVGQSKLEHENREKTQIWGCRYAPISDCAQDRYPEKYSV